MALIAVSALLALVVGAAPAAASTVPEVTRASFSVENVNRSALPCTADGARYRIRGQVIAPRAPRDATALLLLHEFSFGQFFWSFDAVPAYDFAAELARAGYTAVVIDRLGYGDSDHPPGAATCLGAQADIAAQIIEQLLAGSYLVDGPGTATAFVRVLLAGHSVGAGVAELALHSFPELDVAGLMVLAWADQGYSSRSVEQSLQQGRDCLAGGEPAYDDGPGGYAWFGRSEGDFHANVFHRADPAVVAAATARRTRDPCGDNATLARMAAVNLTGVPTIEVPVLLLFGDEDAVFSDGAAERQRSLFRGSPEVTLQRFAGTGHALLLELEAPRVRTAALAWLARHGFGGILTADPGDGSELQVPPPDEGGSAPGVAALPRTGGGQHLLAALLLLASAPVGSRSWRRAGSGGRSTTSAGSSSPRASARHCASATATSSSSVSKATGSCSCAQPTRACSAGAPTT